MSETTVEELTPEEVKLKASEEKKKMWHELLWFSLSCQRERMAPEEYRAILNTLDLQKVIMTGELLGRSLGEKFIPVKGKKKVWDELIQFIFSCRRLGMTPEEYRMILNTLDLQEKKKKVIDVEVQEDPTTEEWINLWSGEIMNKWGERTGEIASEEELEERILERFSSD